MQTRFNVVNILVMYC